MNKSSNSQANCPTDEHQYSFWGICDPHKKMPWYSKAFSYGINACHFNIKTDKNDLAEHISNHQTFLSAHVDMYNDEGSFDLKILEKRIKQILALAPKGFVDLLYIKTPEKELNAGSSRCQFGVHFTNSAMLLEQLVHAGEIASWGLWTDSGLRIEPEKPAYLPLPALLDLVVHSITKDHHFTHIALPFHLMAPQGITHPYQEWQGHWISPILLAEEVGLKVTALVAHHEVFGDLEPLSNHFPSPYIAPELCYRFVQDSPGIDQALWTPQYESDFDTLKSSQQLPEFDEKTYNLFFSPISDESLK